MNLKKTLRNKLNSALIITILGTSGIYYFYINASHFNLGINHYLPKASSIEEKDFYFNDILILKSLIEKIADIIPGTPG